VEIAGDVTGSQGAVLPICGEQEFLTDLKREFPGGSVWGRSRALSARSTRRERVPSSMSGFSSSGRSGRQLFGNIDLCGLAAGFAISQSSPSKTVELQLNRRPVRAWPRRGMRPASSQRASVVFAVRLG